MEREALLERIDGLKEKYGFQYEIAERSGLHPHHISDLKRDLRTEGSTVSLYHIMALGPPHDLAPVVIYNQDGEIQDLGIPGFLNGQHVDNYQGRVIRIQRELNGYTQESLAEKVDNEWRSISRYERGHSIPEWGLFEYICRVLGLTTDYLVEFPLNKNIPTWMIKVWRGS